MKLLPLLFYVQNVVTELTWNNLICNNVAEWQILFLGEWIRVGLYGRSNLFHTFCLLPLLWWDQLVMCFFILGSSWHVLAQLCDHPGDYRGSNTVSISGLCIVCYSNDIPISLEYSVLLLTCMVQSKWCKRNVTFSDRAVPCLESILHLRISVLKGILWPYVEWHHAHVFDSILRE